MGVLQDIWGSKPTVPPLTPLNRGTEQGKAISANQANLPAATNLVAGANLFTRNQISQMMEAVVPNYQAITNQTSGNILAFEQGQVPTDVQQQLQLSDAAQALGGGFAGGGMERNLVARDLGLTSLQLMQTGMTSAQSWLSMMDQIYSPGMMNVASMFVSPTQMASFDVEERNAQFQRQWMQSQINAMPDPVLGGIQEQLHEAGVAFLSAYGGGLGKGMGGAKTASATTAGGDLSNQGMSI